MRPDQTYRDLHPELPPPHPNPVRSGEGMDRAMRGSAAYSHPGRAGDPSPSEWVCGVFECPGERVAGGRYCYAHMAQAYGVDWSHYLHHCRYDDCVRLTADPSGYCAEHGDRQVPVEPVVRLVNFGGVHTDRGNRLTMRAGEDTVALWTLGIVLGVCAAAGFAVGATTAAWVTRWRR